MIQERGGERKKKLYKKNKRHAQAEAKIYSERKIK